METTMLEVYENDLEEALRMPLAEAIAYKDKMGNDGIRRFKFYDDRAFIKYVSSMSCVRSPIFRLTSNDGAFYVVHGEDDYGEVIALLRCRRKDSFVEYALSRLGLPVRSCSIDSILDVLKL